MNPHMKCELVKLIVVMVIILGILVNGCAIPVDAGDLGAVEREVREVRHEVDRLGDRMNLPEEGVVE